MNINQMMGGARPMPNRNRGQGGQQKVQVNVDLEKLPDVLCMACGGKEFIQITHLKRLTKLVSPNGQEGIINANMLKCSNPECGKMFDPNEYKRWEDEQEKKKLEDGQRADDVVEEDSVDTLCRKCGTFYPVGEECPECSKMLKKED